MCWAYRWSTEQKVPTERGVLAEEMSWLSISSHILTCCTLPGALPKLTVLDMHQPHLQHESLLCWQERM